MLAVALTPLWRRGGKRVYRRGSVFLRSHITAQSRRSNVRYRRRTGVRCRAMARIRRVSLPPMPRGHMMKNIGPAIVFAALSAVLAGCTEIPLEPAGSSAQFDTEVGETSNHLVRVQVTGPLPVPGVLVTVTNTQTGSYNLAFTGDGGVATFSLKNGSYLLHARNLSDAGPVVPGVGELKLAIAPLPEGQRLLNTAATQGVNHVSALYTPNGSVPMTPQNYSALSQQPPLVLSGPGTTHDITISFLAGATVTCNLLDAAANAVQLPAAENMF